MQHRHGNKLDLLTVNEFAVALSIRPATVRSWYRAGRLSRVRVGRRAIRIPTSELARLIADGFAPAREAQA